MLLFRDEEHIDRWCRQWKQPRGATLTIEQAWTLAKAWHGSKMSADWRRLTVDESAAVLTSVGLTGQFWNLRA